MLRPFFVPLGSSLGSGATVPARFRVEPRGRQVVLGTGHRVGWRSRKNSLFIVPAWNPVVSLLIYHLVPAGCRLWEIKKCPL